MTLSKKILSGFIVCTIILMAVAIFSFKNSEKFIATNKWVNHTHEVLHELDQILLGSLDAETGTRGFVITNDENYLAPFNSAKSNLSEHIKKVKQLTGDNRIQQENIANIERLVSTYISYLEKKIEYRN